MQVICGGTEHEAHKRKAALSGEAAHNAKVEKGSATVTEYKQVAAVKVAVENAVN
jgi:hypothetical protein